MLWTGRSCRRRQCWLWPKANVPQVPQVHQSCVRTVLSEIDTSRGQAGDAEKALAHYQRSNEVLEGLLGDKSDLLSSSTRTNALQREFLSFTGIQYTVATPNRLGGAARGSKLPR